MNILLRYILLGVALYLAIRFFVKAFQRLGGRRPTNHQGGPSRRDRNNEVKSASFKVEDVQDAKFKDL